MILLINMNEYTIEDVTVGMIFSVYPGRKIQVFFSESVAKIRWRLSHGHPFSKGMIGAIFDFCSKTFRKIK